ncbi:MAG: cation diffusion facilitator family transporter [Actinomycetota bacterium]|nr:cation diffusion facilitator family transporter [Actinomycetota bacterium]
MTDDHRAADHRGHGHGVSADANARYVSIALGLIVGFMVAEAIVAVLSGSLALLADSGHMLTDAGALGASLWAARLALRPAAGAWTFGLKRAEILSAAANGITLLLVSALVTFESIRRLIHPSSVGGLTVVIVALVGVAVNLVAAWTLAKANRSSLNVEGSFQHIVTDLYGFIATVIAGVVLVFTGFERADAIASLVVVVLMVNAAFGLLKASGRVLLEGAPEGVDLSDVRSHLLGTEHVRDIHDLHAWTVTSDLPVLSAHVVVDESCFSDGHAPRLLDRIQACLAGHFDVEHSTFQLEVAGHLDHEGGTH